MTSSARPGQENITNERQPNKPQPDHGQNRQDNPKAWLRIKRQPEEPLICLVLRPRSLLRRLKHPFRIPRGGINFVPPSQTYKPATGNVFQIVEVHREEKNRDDEDEHIVGCEPQAEEVDY